MTARYQTGWFLRRNALPLLDTALVLLVVYPLGVKCARRGVSPPFRIAAQACLLIWSGFMLYVLIRLPQTDALELPKGGAICFTEGRLYLNCHPNTTGLIAMTAFLLCFCLFWETGSKALKAICALSFCVHYCVLVLSNSRTMLTATLIGFSAIVAICVHARLTGRYRAARTAGVALIAAAAFYLLRGATFAAYQALTGLQDQAVGRELIDGGFLTLNGRLSGYRYALTAMRDDVQCFLTGVTPPVVNLALYNASEGAWNMYTHNQFLEIGVALGVPAMACFAGWLFLLIRDGVRLNRRPDCARSIRFVSVLLTVFLLANMLEATLLFYRYILSYVFFFLAGWLAGKRAPRPRVAEDGNLQGGPR